MIKNRILVAGDVMIDRYWRGEVSRLSQEAPVPVVAIVGEESRLGAAANVAANIVCLGGEATLIGITGQDESADLLFSGASSCGINCFILTDPTIRTTQKLRIIGRSQQIVRVDFEEKPHHSITQKTREQILEHEIIVFSDYGKGALSGVAELIAYAKAAGKTVLVDPKGHDYSRYAGADLVKPNLDEIREMTGGWGSEEQLAKKVNALRVDAGIGAVLLTRGGGGMTLYNGSTHHIPAKAREVYDVTGAGDTVMATLAVMLSRGMALRSAADWANSAASVVVAKFGTATLTQEELERAHHGTA